MNRFTHLLLIDIDGLRNDVFVDALQQEKIPNIARLVGGSSLKHGLHMPLISPAPSITFCAQASLFTGTHPDEHGVPGNEFFDRFGRYGNGSPQYYAFDVGGTLAFDDAVRVFTDRLAANCVQQPTLYEKLADQGRRSVVAGNMYATGAETWIKPSVVDLARFLKGGSIVGMKSAHFDRKALQNVLDHLEEHPLPDVLTFYFMGIDVESHENGPRSQLEHLANEIDPMIGELWQAYSARLGDGQPLVAIFSDHGQIDVVRDDRHSLQLAFPFERELMPLFSELGLDVHDHPGEAPFSDAVVALNGGLAFVYIRKRGGDWPEAPRLEEDVLPVAKAFWQAHATGDYAEALENALAGVLVRDVAADGWRAPFRALTPDGELISLETWFDAQPPELYCDPVNRLKRAAGPMIGEIVLISNYAERFYFGPEKSGIHGGLHPDDSTGVLVYGYPTLNASDATAASQAIEKAIKARCTSEGDRLPQMVDLTTGLLAVFE